MSKYARFIWRNEFSDHSIQIIDAIDLAHPAYASRLGCKTEDELLSTLYAPNEARWRADDEWFEAVPQFVVDGMTFIGTWPADQMDETKYVSL